MCLYRELIFFTTPCKTDLSELHDEVHERRGGELGIGGVG